MDDKSSVAKDGPPKKMKFLPKVPPRRVAKPVEPKSEAREDDDALNKELLKRVKEGFGRGGPKVEKKSTTVQVAFGHGAANGRSGFFKNPSSDRGLQQGAGGSGSIPNLVKEYVEPWDYYSYYPVTLPLRRPYSGNPEHLDEQEFGEGAADYDETHINPAAELDLSDNGEGKMLLFQLPSAFPLPNHLASGKDKAIADDTQKPTRKKDSLANGCSLKDLPAGYMGKILIYKSGAVKMKLGDLIFDVNPGLDCSFSQDVALLDHENKQCCVLGEVSKRAIVSPDVNSLIGGIAKLK